MLQFNGRNRRTKLEEIAKFMTNDIHCAMQKQKWANLNICWLRTVSDLTRNFYLFTSDERHDKLPTSCDRKPHNAHLINYMAGVLDASWVSIGKMARGISNQRWLAFLIKSTSCMFLSRRVCDKSLVFLSATFDKHMQRILRLPPSNKENSYFSSIAYNIAGKW